MKLKTITSIESLYIWFQRWFVYNSADWQFENEICRCRNNTRCYISKRDNGSCILRRYSGKMKMNYSIIVLFIKFVTTWSVFLTQITIGSQKVTLNALQVVTLAVNRITSGISVIGSKPFAAFSGTMYGYLTGSSNYAIVVYYYNLKTKKNVIFSVLLHFNFACQYNQFI
jgi:hypothetical protein